MAEVVWSARARRDLQSIYDAIAEGSVTAADRLLDRIVRAATLLETFPCSGRMVPEVQHESVREVIVGRYRVTYYVEGDLVEIRRILSASRPLRRGELHDLR